jgi:hypothetical protein
MQEKLPMRVVSFAWKRRRALSSGLVVLLLVLLGRLLHAWLPPEPRWVRPFPFDNAVFSPDGSRLLVSSRSKDNAAPLQLSDVESGHVVKSFGDWPGTIEAEAVSRDFQRWAGAIQSGNDDKQPQLRVIDLTTGAETTTTIALSAGEEVAAGGVAFSVPRVRGERTDPGIRHVL